jgi:hypothetical protein
VCNRYYTFLIEPSIYVLKPKKYNTYDNVDALSCQYTSALDRVVVETLVVRASALGFSIGAIRQAGHTALYMAPRKPTFTIRRGTLSGMMSLELF